MNGPTIWAADGVGRVGVSPSRVNVDLSFNVTNVFGDAYHRRWALD